MHVLILYDLSLVGFVANWLDDRLVGWLMTQLMGSLDARDVVLLHC